MEPVDVFTVRDLRARTGDFLRDAEEGRASLVTKHGRPVILAIPFDEPLLREGVNRSLALRLFEDGDATLAQAAKIARLKRDEFLDLLDAAGIPAVGYSADELDDEAEIAG
jgi:prevent-host-death family protein